MKVIKIIIKGFLWFLLYTVGFVAVGLSTHKIYWDYEPAAPDIKKSDRINIVWILAEDLSCDLACYGDSTAKTPNIDRLAAEGLTFDNAFTTAPICAPSKSCLYTGVYQNYLGTHEMRTSWKDYEAVPPPEVKVFTEFLRKAGYYCSKNGHSDYQFGHAEIAWDKINATFLPLVKVRNWREREDGQPFFSVINLMETHESQQWMRLFAKPTVDPGKVPIPPYYADDPVIRHDIAMMYSNIERLDKRVGEYLKKLEEDGLNDNTIVIFFGDHGRGMPRSKRFLYDGGLKVPMVIRWPGKLKGGTRTDELVSFVDMAPTMLSITGMDIPSYIQGKAFLGDHKDSIPRQYVYGSRDRADETVDKIRSVRNKRFLFIRNFMPDVPWTAPLMFRDIMPTMKRMRELYKEGKLNEIQSEWFAQKKPPEELYDTKNDPWNAYNLAGEQQYDSIQSLLKTKLDEWITKYDRYFDMPEAEMIEQMWPGHVQPVTKPPVFNRKGKSFKTPFSLTLSSPTDGASIEYKITGGRNRTNGWKLYDKPLTIDDNCMIHARALRYGYKMSEEVSTKFEKED